MLTSGVQERIQRRTSWGIRVTGAIAALAAVLPFSVRGEICGSNAYSYRCNGQGNETCTWANCNVSVPMYGTPDAQCEYNCAPDHGDAVLLTSACTTCNASFYCDFPEDDADEYCCEFECHLP